MLLVAASKGHRWSENCSLNRPHRHQAGGCLITPRSAQRDPQRAERARRVAADNNITIIWQDPCFEAVLLRHLEGHATRRPPDTPEGGRALLRVWPDYQKPMPRAGLARRIDRASVLRAAAVEPELEVLLRCLGLI